MDHEPVELRADRRTLLALAAGISGYRVEEIPGGSGDVCALWFQADQLYLVSVDTLGLAFKFEVFTLAINTPAEMLSIMQANAPDTDRAWAEIREAGIPLPMAGPPVEPAPAGPLAPWPFRAWRLDVLKRREYIVSPEYLPSTAEAMDQYLASLGPDEAPAGSEHSCLTAIGLLFTSHDGRRLLIVADGMPGLMRVTNEEEIVQSYLRQCIAVSASDYLASL